MSASTSACAARKPATTTTTTTTQLCSLVVSMMLVAVVNIVGGQNVPAELSLDDYPDHYNTVSYISKMTKHYQKLVEVRSIGKSVENLDLLVMRISADKLRSPTASPNDQLVPAVRLVGTIHGDEPLGLYLLLKLANYLCSSYGHNEKITKLLINTNIELVPLMNPDGYRVARKGDCVGGRYNQTWNGRENAHGVDLGTNFEVRERGTEPESMAVMKWTLDEASFVLGASIHTGMLGVLYPPHDSKKPSPDEPLFRWLARDFVDLRGAEKAKAFKQGCGDQQIDDGAMVGGKYLSSRRTLGDFSYTMTNSFDLELYLSCCKYSNGSDLEAIWEENRDVLVNFIESAHMGIKGVVLEEGTHRPIEGAIISVHYYGHNLTSSDQGVYWRLLLPGRYKVTVSAYRYVTQTKVVEVMPVDSRYNAQVVNFNLKLDKGFKKEPHSADDIEMPKVTSSMTPSLKTKATSPLHEIEGRPTTTTTTTTTTTPGFIPFHKPGRWLEHHNYVQMVEAMQKMADRYPAISRLYSVGKSGEKRDIYVLEISDQPGVHEPGEPEFKYVANMHGNEVLGREMVLLLAQLLLENYGVNDRLTKLVNTTRIHLMPSLNPDGYERSRLGDCDSEIGRGNAKNVDLNRNFPDQYLSYDENHKQEPEVLVAMNWLRSYPFVLSANLHGGSLVANYPFDGNWDITKDGYNGTPDDKLFRHLAKVYSYNHPYMHKGRPCRETCGNRSYLMNEFFPEGIVNGAKWYSLYGGMQDWNYLHTNCFEITVEMGCFKFPYSSELDKAWRENQRPMLALMDEVHKGVTGFVLDASTNRSVVGARVHVEGIRHPIKSVEPYGDYWRLLLPGAYQLTVEMPGYHNQSKLAVVSAAGATHLNFTLRPVHPEYRGGARPKQDMSEYTLYFLVLTLAAILVLCALFYLLFYQQQQQQQQSPNDDNGVVELFNRYDFDQSSKYTHETSPLTRWWHFVRRRVLRAAESSAEKKSKEKVIYSKLVNDRDVSEEEDLEFP